MQPPPAAEIDTCSTELRLFTGSASFQDPDFMEASSSLEPWSSNVQKRKLNQVFPHDLIKLNGAEDPATVAIIGESTSDSKNKQAVEYDKDWEKQVALPSDLLGLCKIQSSGYDAPLDILDSFGPDSLNFNSIFNHEYDDFEDDDNEEYEYDHDLMSNDFNSYLAAEYDDMDLPLGVEVTLPLLKNSAPEGPSTSKRKSVIDAEIDKNFTSFKQFDAVQDHSDHHYSRAESVKGGCVGENPPKDWAKKIQHEWKILENGLPGAIFVRVYEKRMDLLRAVILGPAGTPYHDGLFFFDICLPPTYPQEPPLVHYHSGGLRLNPNLYGCGKVCLSLLNTWSGEVCEKWNPSQSTVLQILVSIQALVLNTKPYFNEPGYELTANTTLGEKKSLLYNEKAFLLSCKTMLYSLRRPLKNFEDFVAGHFRKSGHTILMACRAYMDGAQVGCVVGEVTHDAGGDKSSSSRFKTSLEKIFKELLQEFTWVGVDCDEFLTKEVEAGASSDEFLAQKIESGAATAVDTTLKL